MNACLAGKVAVVIGAAAKDNMGQAIARKFAGAGAKVVVAGRHEAILRDLAAEIDGDWQLCDVARKAEVESLADVVVCRHGYVDVALNAAGWGLLKSLHEISEDELDAIIALQFKGVHFFLSAFVRAMTRGGSIIQISSATTRALIDDHAAYIGTKAGAEALIRCIANQYGPQGIRANTISPGLTETSMTVDAVATPGLVSAFVREYPLGRLGTPDDIANAALWLASDESFMTGQNLQINGGLTLRRNPRPEEIGAAVAAAMTKSQAEAHPI